MRRIIFLVLSVSLLFAACSSSQKTEIKTKHSTVLIMPFSYTEKYPFKFDQERKSLVWAFESNGFVINESEGVWNKIEEGNLRLSNLYEADIFKMATISESDLIIYSYNRNLKVFDCKKKTIISYKSEFETAPLNYQTLVMRLVGLGY